MWPIRFRSLIFISKSNLFRRSSAVPKQPIVPERNTRNTTPPRKIDSKTIEHLERLSLVDFANREGIRRLEDAIAFADLIHSVDTTGVEPLVTVLEDEGLFVREDCVTDGNIREDILANASVTEEEYFLAPPGNIPLTSKEDKYSSE